VSKGKKKSAMVSEGKYQTKLITLSFVVTINQTLKEAHDKEMEKCI